MTTPPPNPFGQQPGAQPPYGFPPAQPPGGQPPYGSAPGQQPGAQAPYGYPPAQPQPGGQPYGYPPAPQPYDMSVPPEKQGLSLKAKTFLWGSGAVIAVGAVGGMWYTLFGGGTGAHVGDCMQYAPVHSKTVSCSSASADTIVLKRFEVPLFASCSKVPGTIHTYEGRYRKRNKSNSYLVCLGPHTPGKSS